MMDLRDLLISNVLMPLMGCISNIVNSRQHTLNSEYAPDVSTNKYFKNNNLCVYLILFSYWRKLNRET